MQAPDFKLFRNYSLFNFPGNQSSSNVILYYRGPMSSDVLKEISQDIKVKLYHNQVLSRRAFSIYMELAQNILYYSPEKIKIDQHEESIGAVLLLEKDTDYFFSCANLIENDQLKDIIGHCEMINSLNRKALRDYKRAQRKAPPKKYSKGAGIGLIQVSITARSPILLEYRKIDDFYSLFALTTNISQDNHPEDY